MVPATWIVGNLGEYYGAGASGLSIFDNTCTITLQANKEDEVASLVDVVPTLPEEVKIISQAKGAAIDHKDVHVEGLPYHPIRVIQGKIPWGEQAVTLKTTSSDPAYWAAYTLHRALQEQSIEVTQVPTTVRRNQCPITARQDLCTTFSPPLNKLIIAINHDSLNSYTEHLLKHLSLAAAGPGDTPGGVDALKQF